MKGDIDEDFYRCIWYTTFNTIIISVALNKWTTKTVCFFNLEIELFLK